MRRTAAQFLSQTVEQYGPAQLLHAPKDLLERTLIATLNCVTDAAVDPRLMQHSDAQLFIYVHNTMLHLCIRV